MATQDIKPKIIAEIKQSGFPLELDVTEKLRKAGNIVFPNISFQTAEGDIKELDIYSIGSSKESEWSLGPVSLAILVECKKSNKYPWVFFEQIYDPAHSYGLLSKADYSTDYYDGSRSFNPMKGCMNTILASHHYNDKSIPTSRTYFELGKKANEPTTIFKAVMNIFHGRKFLNQRFVDGKNTLNKGRTQLNQYAIVLEGELYVAKKENEEFNVEAVSHLILIAIDTFVNTGANYFGNELLIDVMTKDHFDHYIKVTQRETKDFCSHLSKIQESKLTNPTKEMP